MSSTANPARTPPGPMLLLRAFGSIVAPLTFLTALMYYFGVLHAFWFFRTFGVDYTVFQLSTQDYLLRSADGLFVPLTVAAVGCLLALWGTRLVPEGLFSGREREVVRTAAIACAVSGGALSLLATLGVLAPELLYTWVSLPGLALAIGVLLLLAASRLWWWSRGAASEGRPPPSVPPAVAATEWSAVLVLVGMGLFWAAGDWSAAVGTRRGEQVIQGIAAWPDAVVYSRSSLGLNVPNVRETVCSGPEACYRYRYDGLKLVVQAGGQYLLLPTGYTSAEGRAVVLATSEEVRLEYTAVAREAGAPLPGC